MSLPVRPLAAAALLLALAVAAGCAKKVTTVDPNFTQPEGRPSANSRLVLWPDLPVNVTLRLDIEPPGESSGDIDSSITPFHVDPGAIHGLIADHTTASAFQVLRRDPNGGYRVPWDFLLTPRLRFVDLDWELYAFDDTHPSGYAPPTYIGRGVVSNAITATSPLTNPAMLVPDTLRNINVASDSLRSISWAGVPNAAGYYVQVYTYTGGLNGNIAGAVPAPLEINTVRNTYVSWVPAGNVAGAIDLTNRPVIPGAFYFVRVTAVDAAGELIGFSNGDSMIVPAAHTYQIFPRGARVFAGAKTHTVPRPVLNVLPEARLAASARQRRTWTLAGGRIVQP